VLDCVCRTACACCPTGAVTSQQLQHSYDAVAGLFHTLCVIDQSVVLHAPAQSVCTVRLMQQHRSSRQLRTSSAHAANIVAPAALNGAYTRHMLVLLAGPKCANSSQCRWACIAVPVDAALAAALRACTCLCCSASIRLHARVCSYARVGCAVQEYGAQHL
jgi:hypothetical protein